MTEQMEQMIFNEGYRRGKVDEAKLWKSKVEAIQAEYKEVRQATYNEGYRRGKAERHKMLDDGTLVVSVDDATKVTRVLVEDSKKNGDLYYNDRLELDVVELIDGNVTMSEETYNELIDASVRPKGKWIFRHEFVEDIPFTGYRCSNCNYWQGMGAWNFCPDCGADMRGEDNE